MLMTENKNEEFFNMYERMTKAIADVLKNKEECFPSDLDDSFSDDEIQDNWLMSLTLAKIMITGEAHE